MPQPNDLLSIKPLMGQRVLYHGKLALLCSIIAFMLIVLSYVWYPIMLIAVMFSLLTGIHIGKVMLYSF